MPSVWLVPAVILIAAYVVHRFWSTYALQYLYFLRHSLLLAVALAVFLPAAASTSLLGNLFVFDQGEPMISTAFFAVVAGWVTVWAVLLMWQTVPVRVALMFRKRDQKDLLDRKAKNPMTEWEPNKIFWWLEHPVGRLVAATILAANLIRTCIRESQGFFLEALYGVVAALVVLGVVSFVGFKTENRRRAWQQPITKFYAWWDRILFGKEISGQETGYESKGKFNHGDATVALLVFFVFYAIFYFLLKPGLEMQTWQDLRFPAMTYMLVLLLLVTWVLQTLAFFFDKYRIPPELALVVFAAALYGWTTADHYFEFAQADCGVETAVAPPIPSDELVGAWRDSKDRPLVVVAASGGGIKAAYWTATVLTRLQEEIGEPFSRSVRFLSTASGGSVGAMYFVDQYTPDRAPDDLHGVRWAAGRSSLSATAWGLVYPDFLRFFPLPLFGLEDRGWALETRWEQPLPNRPTLRSWAEGVAQGWRPLLALNATLADSGQRLVIASTDVAAQRSPDGEAMGQAPAQQGKPCREFAPCHFSALYPGADLRLTTAARLSATFPWVTPMSRPEVPPGCETRYPEKLVGYHVADGGYSDNFGVVTAIEFLQRVLPAYQAAGGSKVLFVQIQAFESSEAPGPSAFSGFRFETLGPIDTMMAAREAGQVERNNVDIAFLTKQWGAQDVVIKPVTFTLEEPGPLSWHLSMREKLTVCNHWSKKGDRANEVASFFSDNPRQPAPLDCDADVLAPY